MTRSPTKIPRYIKFVDEFPMTATGEIQKFKMKEIAVEELGLERAKEMKTAYERILDS